MLTPTFSCSQDDAFVKVVIYLSLLAKVSSAVFDITDNQFTMYCKPFYLRLRFDQCLCEGAGERATFELETQCLTVFLPKAVRGELFTQLDHPQYLLGTERQRRQMKRLVAEIPEEEEEQQEEEVEYIQQQRQDGSALSAAAPASSPHHEEESDLPRYGFENAFSGLFRKLDVDLVSEIVETSEPDALTFEERRQCRLQQENRDFELDAVLMSMEDEDGEVERLLKYVPAHIQDLQRALTEQNVVYIKASEQPAHSKEFMEQEEEEERLFTGESGGEVWRGNVMDFQRPPVIEVLEPETDPASTSLPSGSGDRIDNPTRKEGEAPPPKTILAIPRSKPVLELTREENTALLRVRLPELWFPPSKVTVVALTADLLLAEAYDDVFSEGSGCCESVWNVCKLSPSLSFLDKPETLYEACFFFARRFFTYPLHRHPVLLSRLFALVGSRMLLGTRYVVRALLRIRSILSHSEHKHLLCTIFMDPLIAYWMSVKDGDDTLMRAAVELHEHAVRTRNVVVTALHSSLAAVAFRNTPGGEESGRRITLRPLTIHNLDLPIDLNSE